MDTRRAARWMVIGIFGFGLAFVGWALWHFRVQAELVATLDARGVQLVGTVSDKTTSDRSDDGTMLTRYFLEVDYTFESRRIVREFSVEHADFDLWKVGDTIGVRALAEDPGRARIEDLAGNPILSLGFIATESNGAPPASGATSER